MFPPPISANHVDISIKYYAAGKYNFFLVNTMYYSCQNVQIAYSISSANKTLCACVCVRMCVECMCQFVFVQVAHALFVGSSRH